MEYTNASSEYPGSRNSLDSALVRPMTTTPLLQEAYAKLTRSVNTLTPSHEK
ncbi:MAG: hypothetical protein ACQESG_03940 [Nanobdellota archaeon]